MTIETFENNTPQIADSAFIHRSALIIGAISIDEDSSIWPMSVLRGDINTIKIGKRSNIQDGTIIHVTHAGEFDPDGKATLIGDDVIIGHQAVIHGCTIESGSLIGIGARILDGAVIKSQVMVGAGSVVSPGKVLESGYLYLGAPARRVRPLTEKEVQFLAYNADHYVTLKNKYQANEKTTT